MLERLEAGQLVIVGEQVLTVSAELAAAFRAGDRLVAVASTGDLLHVPAAAVAAAGTAVDAAVEAFGALGAATDEQITTFFDRFAGRLADDTVMEPVFAANAADVERAVAAGRSTTRLVMSDSMRAAMVDGLRAWRDSPLRRDGVAGVVEHDGWKVEARRAPLGVVAFVFEGRPNVFADAAGVVRTGNTVVMRIGGDALGTADALVGAALAPALAEAGLPAGTVSLVSSRDRAAGWALFARPELALAVARGSGPAVAQLGGVARQAGTPVSLHGTGGAWLVAGRHADAERFGAAVFHSLDRKVCNTLNVCCIPSSRADLVPVFLDAADRAGAALGAATRLHVVEGCEPHVPAERFDRVVGIERADGVHDEPQASSLPRDRLAQEWEWEHSPEVTLAVTEGVEEAVELCNRYSPRFVASLVSDDAAEHDGFYAAVDAPFVGDGFTRWVDGQYALNTPELGLANWQHGRLLARGGVLSGDSVHTIRYRATIADAGLHR
jgi:glutamate-5-semialdehyde dehydrogenase